ncbi:hypothetical protein Avbf_18047 [Armadillidium vulgare]|nr:hypothetical protein Avbf_18047 [Armadillidium vulgare]
MEYIKLTHSLKLRRNS